MRFFTLHYRARAVIGIQSRDSDNVLCAEIKLCRGTKANWSLLISPQVCPSNLKKKRNPYQEIPPCMLDSPVLPLQGGNLEVFKRPSLLSPHPMFEHGSLVKYLVPEKHLFRVLRAYDGVPKGFRR